MLTTLSRDRKLLVDLLKEAKSVSMRTEEGKIVIYTSSGGAEWRPFGQPRTKRPLSSVVLDQGMKETLVADIKEFMGRARWYGDRGTRTHPLTCFSFLFCWRFPSLRVYLAQLRC
jgi:chaperone BCS1